MTPLAGWTPENRIALAVLAASLALCAASAAGARRLDPLPEASRSAALPAMPEVPARGAGRSDAVVLAAVARDPFRPDRKRPPGRYRMPGEAVAPDPSLTMPPPVPMVTAPVYNFRLLGTVATASGGLAAIAGQTGESRVMRVGQEIEGFRLTRVSPGTATLAGNDTTLVLRMEGQQ